MIKKKARWAVYLIASMFVGSFLFFKMSPPAWAEEIVDTWQAEQDAIEALNEKINLIIKKLDVEKKLTEEELDSLRNNDSVIQYYMMPQQARKAISAPVDQTLQPQQALKRMPVDQTLQPQQALKKMPVDQTLQPQQAFKKMPVEQTLQPQQAFKRMPVDQTLQPQQARKKGG